MFKKRIKAAVILISLFFIFSTGFLSCKNPFSWNLFMTGDTEDVADGEGTSVDGEDTNDEADDPLEGSDPSKITVQGESFTLSWDPPENEPVSGYKVYFRVHGETAWIELNETNGNTQTYTVHYPDLDYGEYDFAVTSVHEGDESDYHTSLDTTAMPESGWYLDWQAEG